MLKIYSAAMLLLLVFAGYFLQAQNAKGESLLSLLKNATIKYQFY